MKRIQMLSGAMFVLGLLAAARMASAGATGIEAWRASAFGTSASDASIAGDNADPDADGAKNLMEYALGTDPNVPTANGTPVMGAAIVGGVDSFTLTYRKLRSDILYTVEKSDDATNWNAVADVTAGTDNGVELRQASVPKDGSQKFLRLTVAVVNVPNTPVAPSDLSATAASTSQINLAWTDNSGTGFKIERKTGAGGTYVQIGTVGAGVTTYSNTGLSTATTYYYQVRATNANGDSSYTPEANATTLDVVPAAPSGVALSGITSSSITVTWTDNSNGTTGNETSFKILRRTGTSGNFLQVGTVGANIKTYQDTTVASATTYYYLVRASNSGGDSGNSNTPNATTTGAIVAAPSALTVTPVDSNQMNLAWTDNSGNETGFIIERSPTGVGGTWVPIATIGAGVTTYQDTTGLSGSTTYYYHVRAVSGSDSSPFSTATAAKTFVPAPTNLTLTVLSKSQIRLNWQDNSTNEGSFSIERKIDAGGTYASAGSVSANVTTFQNNSLLTDTLYFFRVRVPQIPYGTSSDHSNYTPEISVLLLPAPVLTAAAVSPTEIDLAWPNYPSPNAVGFKLERRPDTDSTWTEIATLPLATTSYADTGLPANTAYTYRVRAYRDPVGIDAGGASEYSNNASTSTQLDPTLPSPWLQQDVGTPGDAGYAGYVSGTFIIKGSGSNNSEFVTGMPTSDSFHYVYQPLSGNGSIVARVASFDHTNDWATTGVMIRDGLLNTSDYVMVAVTPGYGHGVSFMYRTTAGSSVRITPEDGVTAPCWVKLVRSGDTFTGYKSTDGTTWVPVGTITIPMATSVSVGMPVCSRISDLAKAQIDSVTVTAGSVPAIPSAPSGLAVSGVTTSQAILTWTDNSNNETGFRIERSLTGAAGSYVVVGTVGAGVQTFMDTGLTAGTLYHYVVASYSGGGEAASADLGVAALGGSPLISVGKPSTALDWDSRAAPKYANDGSLTGTGWGANNGGLPKWWRVDLGATYTMNKVKITWPRSATISYKYKIEVSSNDVNYTTVVDQTGHTALGDTTDNFTATGRYLRVTITGVSVTGTWVGITECRVYRAGSEPLGASNLTAAAAGPNQAALTWKDNSTNETGFKIERRVGTGGDWVQCATTGAAAASGTTVNYTDSGLAAGTQYYYRVLAYNDVNGDALDYSNESTPITTSTAGAFTYKYWTGITGSAVSALTASTNFPDTPNGSYALNTFEAPYSWGNSYGQMIDGQIHPPTTGSYTFWIAGTETAELWLSTDSTPANAILIAKVEAATGSRNWTKFAEINGLITQMSAPISLVGGQSYYIKALHKEDTGTGDSVAVAWRGPGFSRQVISDTGVPMTSAITSPTNGATFVEGSNITINATATPAAGRTITRVEFLLNGDSKVEAKLGEDTTAPYSFTWNNVASGSYVFTERAWDSAGVSTSSSVKVMVTNASFGSGAWTDRILNGDGSINWTEYANVANNYERRDMVEYRFGPSYAYYHPTPGTFPTLSTLASESGVVGHSYIAGTETDWYSEGGQLVFSPNASAATGYQSGVAQAINGDCYLFSGTPGYCFINGIQWSPDKEPYHGQSMPDPSVRQSSFIAANGGSVPAPIATIRGGGTGDVTGFLIFKNGFILAAGNGATDNYGNVIGSPRYPFVQLAAGKVPTAGAVTLNNEFLLVSIWDTTNHKGQIAVIAIHGAIRAQQSALVNHLPGDYFWGLGNRQTIKSLKVLGYIDLPAGMAAPSAIKVTDDLALKDGVGISDNTGLSSLLNSQAERDTWYAWSGSVYKRTPKSGYAVVASRAENKVTFIDLQPLFEYYRQMYFTTQANYDLTKSQGMAPDQWPFTFGYAPQQVPTIFDTISVAQPSALMAGMPQNPNGGAGSTAGYKGFAYVASMDGHYYKYDVGSLMTTATGGSIGAPVTTVTIGKNPTSIDFNLESFTGSAINCRGDKVIDLVDPAEVIISTLRDSRIQDPIYTAESQNGRGSYGFSLFHVMDFEGSQIHTYRYGSATGKIPVTEPSGFEFTNTDPMPGCPIMFTRMGQN